MIGGNWTTVKMVLMTHGGRPSVEANIERDIRGHRKRRGYSNDFLAGDFFVRSLPVLCTFERGCAKPSRTKGKLAKVVVAASPKKLERLMPSSDARLSTCPIRLFGR